mmetsp:Transcript_1394/g.3713  ORF Transcript_1394/g.3713 Transcript_1394/m.3713 type:complete len:125 (+) Transcript_1394:377-751(+)
MYHSTVWAMLPSYLPTPRHRTTARLRYTSEEPTPCVASFQSVHLPPQVPPSLVRAVVEQLGVAGGEGPAGECSKVVRIDLSEPQRAPATGQVAVFYDGDVCTSAAVIVHSVPHGQREWPPRSGE